MATTSYQGSREDVRALMQRLPAVLAGSEPDVAGVARSLQLRLGVALLSKVHQAFVVKARGGVGEDGIRWLPLSPKTVAARRISAGERKAAGVGGRRTRGLLTPAQDATWRRIFAQTRARLRLKGVSEGAAKAQAARTAWSVLKAQGAKTRLATFGSRVVEIGRDTGVLFRSLAPGVEDRPSGADGQEFQTPPGRVIVGSKVPYAEHYHARRPLWPQELPAAWWEALRQTCRRGLAKLLGQYLAQGKV